jgi:SAM-dependent methyltransferase
MYRLFHEFAHRYDLHTPPGHYKHDHAFVIEKALETAPSNCRLLDVGCGTGVFLQAAIAAGIDGYGIDAAPEMIDMARQRLGDDRVRVQRMQDISETGTYDVICALSWTIHYCQTESELRDVLIRCRQALKPGGILLLQVANDEAMNGEVRIDRETGPSGEPNDTIFIHRFLPQRNSTHGVIADYVYASQIYNELFSEEHTLEFSNPSIIIPALIQSGFEEVRMTHPNLLSPFMSAIRPSIDARFTL